MLYANKNGFKVKASRNQVGSCIGCYSTVKSYCGEINIWHWRHVNKSDLCDNWHEPETEWHLNWKKLFKEQNTEVRICKDEKWHIADIFTETKVVIELQYSNIDKRIIELREKFYGQKMIWILNPKQLSVNSINLDKSDYNTPNVFQVYYDIKELGYPIWVVDLLDFKPSKSLVNSLVRNGFSFNESIQKYEKLILSKNNKKRFEIEIEKDLVNELKLFSIDIQNKEPNLRKFSLNRVNKRWKDSQRTILIDNLDGSLDLIKSFNGQYGILKEISKQSIIKKYS